jgi:hypothetical protein
MILSTPLVKTLRINFEYMQSVRLHLKMFEPVEIETNSVFFPGLKRSVSMLRIPNVKSKNCVIDERYGAGMRGADKPDMSTCHQP